MGKMHSSCPTAAGGLPEDLIRPAPLLKKTGASMLNLGVKIFSIKLVKLPLRTSVHVCACKSRISLLHATQRAISDTTFHLIHKVLVLNLRQ